MSKIFLKDASPSNEDLKTIQKNVLKRIGGFNVGFKGKKFTHNVSESSRKKTKTLTKKKESKNFSKLNKESMFEESLVNLVSFTKIKEGRKDTVKSPEISKIKTFKKKNISQKSPKRLNNKKLV